jgi:outer membrane protein
MKRNIFVMVGIVSLLFVWSSSSLAADIKIGFINMREIIQTSHAGKKAGEELKRVAEAKQGEITSAEKELKNLKEDLDKKGSVLTAAARREKEIKYQKKLSDYQFLVNAANEDLHRRDQEIFQKLMPDIVKVVRTIAEKEKYTLIIDVASQPIPYFDKTYDISKRVIEEYNKK